MINAGLYTLGDLMVGQTASGIVITSGFDVNGNTVAYLDQLADMSEMSVEFAFTYGSAGTSFKARLQTSMSQGARWRDLACFTATLSTRIVDFSLRRTADTVLGTPHFGDLADDTIASNIVFGDRLRVICDVVGAYQNTLFSARVNCR